MKEITLKTKLRAVACIVLRKMVEWYTFENGGNDSIINGICNGKCIELVKNEQYMTKSEEN